MADKKKTEVLLKVVIDTEKNKVVFAEASSEFIDILFSFLTLPMGTIVRVLAKHSDPSHQPVNIGSFNTLYESVANLDAMYFGKECKNMLLNTRNSAEILCRKLKINIDDTKLALYFICEDCKILTTVICEDCGGCLNRKFNFISGASLGNLGGYVTKTSSFVISDDLQVIPNNPASTLRILEYHGIKDFAVLEEKTLKLGFNEILDLLQCSFLSKTALSDIFFGKKRISSPVPTIQSRIRKKCTEAKKMTVKVFVQKSNNKVLLAESSEDFIDFLFSLLTIPLGKVISLMTRDQESLLSIENIHQSVSELNVYEYFISQERKIMLLNPKMSMHYLCSNNIFSLEEETDFWERMPDGEYKKYMTLDNSRKKYTIKRKKGADGFIGGPTKFMVTDDLVVTPSSSIACFTYLHRMKMTPSDIEVQVVEIGMEEALNLLRASLTSTEVLTNGLKFLIRKNAEPETSLNKAQSERLLKKPKVEK